MFNVSFSGKQIGRQADRQTDTQTVIEKGTPTKIHTDRMSE